MDAPRFSAETVRRYRLAQMNARNLIRAGAAIDGVYTTPEEEDIANWYQEMEEKKKGKGRFLKWMYIFSEASGDWHPIEVKLDSGAEPAGANFVTPGMVRQYLLEPVIRIPETGFSMPDGHHFSCDEAVDIVWKGKDGVGKKLRWFVLPETSRIRMPMVGQDFIIEYGDLLFDEQPAGTDAGMIGMIEMGPVSKAEEIRNQQIRDEADAEAREEDRIRAAHCQKSHTPGYHKPETTKSPSQDGRNQESHRRQLRRGRRRRRSTACKCVIC
ncbi:hypothetical protein VTK56DRAFT_3650 [Thermocarpiscus australiensis]